MTIQDFITHRGIDIVLHFTRLQNLPTIAVQGLVVRSAVPGSHCCDDEFRWDGTNAVCASIGFPNYKMFWSLRQKDTSVDWIILGIKPRALFELRCAYCKENAASNNVSCIPLDQRMTLAALQQMYDDECDDRKRVDLPIPDDYPTHPQAEVLFLDGVPLSYIGAILVQDEAMKQKILRNYSAVKIKIVVAPYYFNGRKDFSHWRPVAS